MNRWRQIGHSCLLLAAVLLFCTGSALAQPTAQLAPGNPPLTQEMVDQAQWFYEWILDAQMTQQQRTELRESWVKSWGSGDPAQVKSCLDDLEQAAEVSNYTSAERELLREAILPDLLKQLRDAAPSSSEARWLLSLYESAHQPIADGNPPLTRQMSDASAEALVFMLSEVVGEEFVPPDVSLRDAFAQDLAANYSQYAPEQQEAISQMPMLWAAIKVAWPNATEDTRESMRQQWAEVLGPVGQEAFSSPEEPSEAPVSSSNGGSEAARSYASHQLLMQASHNTFLSSVNVIRGNYSAVTSYGAGPR